ncbi:FecR family protein [Paracoccus yeei]|uniref:FecR family protein n=1 Tax=Paracoccus yeei TaxID=147645 RepID=UPI00174A7D3E|nr:FecR domain-containing protein [Paracoccus yeei]
MSDPDLIAVAWMTRMNGRPRAADLQDFQSWLAENAAHREAWQRVTRSWQALDALQPPAEDEADLQEALSRIRAARTGRRNRRGTGLAALSLLVFLLVGLGTMWLEAPHLLSDWRADQVTARGELRQVNLPDGSVMLLDADSAAETDFDAGTRRVTLVRGTAHFDIRPDAIPFVVRAADGEARVLGTAFDVAVAGDRVEITLERGSLAVTRDRQEVRLHPGQTVSYGATLGQPGPADLQQAQAWQARRLVFDDMPLVKVVSRIERYRKGRILVADSALGRRRISGALSLADPDAALQSLQALAHFRMTSLAGRLVVLY